MPASGMRAAKTKRESRLCGSGFVDKLLASGVEVAIPPHPRAKAQRAYDKRWYRERNLVERYFNKIKHFRRVFSRFEKLDTSHLGFLHFDGTQIWLRQNVNRPGHPCVLPCPILPFALYRP